MYQTEDGLVSCILTNPKNVKVALGYKHIKDNKLILDKKVFGVTKKKIGGNNQHMKTLLLMM